MGLSKLAEQIDRTLENAENSVNQRSAAVVESNALSMAHHITAYVLERAVPGTSAESLGKVMIEGAFIGESESGSPDGLLADATVVFLESLLQGAKDALAERIGGEAPTEDPVEHAISYHLSHGTWPTHASADVIAKAKSAMSAGAKGSGKPRGIFI